MTAPSGPSAARQRRGALAILREGRCTIREATSEHWPAPCTVEAAVRSSRPGGPTYAVDFTVIDPSDGTGARWLCTCSPQPDPGCSHVMAVQLVTGGWES